MKEKAAQLVQELCGLVQPIWENPMEPWLQPSVVYMAMAMNYLILAWIHAATPPH